VIRPDLSSGSEPIAFSHLRVELAKRIRLTMPEETMLCTLWVRAFVPDGELVAGNYVQFHVDAGADRRQELDGRTLFRLSPHDWHGGEWNRAATTREEAARLGYCQGGSRGHFEWRYPIGPEQLRHASRLLLLVEASSYREGAPQTDAFTQPSTLRISLNGVPVYHTILPNHPHDARGALSYLNGGRGGYGYLCHANVEGPLLEQVKAAIKGTHVRLRCTVPRDEQPQGGLTIYGGATGRYPLGPTVILE
jgi:hypothetical protein